MERPNLGEKRLGDDLGSIQDQALAARVLSVAEKSKLRRDAGLLGALVGGIVLKDPTLYPRIKTLFAASKDVNLRNAVVTSLLPSNPDNDEVLNWTRAVMKDPSDKRLARNAMIGFAKMRTQKTARCDAYLENIENADTDHAGDAV